MSNLTFLPVNLRSTLMPFQSEGITFALQKNGRCLIADEMGLGKTLQALCVAYYYKDQWPLLIVVPSSLRYPWIEELERWLPEIHPHQINLVQSGADISAIAHASITIVSYGLLRHPGSKLLQEALVNQHFRVAIVDESHYIKNRTSATTKYLMPLLRKTERKILLTGTPALARPEELYPQLESLCPGQFGSWSDYARRYCDARWQYFGRHQRKWTTAGASNLEELQSLLTERVMIRRLKEAVLTQLPKKRRQRIPFELKDSHLKKNLEDSWTELNHYLGRERRTLTDLIERSAPEQPSEGSAYDVFRTLGQLRMDTCAAKIGPVKDYMKMLCEDASLKILVFAHHHIMLNALSEQMHDLNMKCIRIDGSTPGLDRPRFVHQFQVDPDTRVAILSIKAAGVGLTLTAASIVVFAELDWTPGTMEQCEDRAHRIGQQDTVHVHYLVAKGTLDELVWSALSKKTTVLTTTLNGETQVLKMAEADENQIACLGNAEAYVPTNKNLDSSNIASFFQSDKRNDQKTLLDYMTPKQKQRKQKPSKPKDPSQPVCVDEIIVCDSDDNDDFKSPKLNLRNGPVGGDSTQDVSTFDLGIEDIKSSESETSFISPPKQAGGDGIEEKAVDNGAAETSMNVDEDLDDKTKWSCEQCTFLNHQLLNVCEMCSSPVRRKVKRCVRSKWSTRKRSLKDISSVAKKRAKQEIVEGIDGVKSDEQTESVVISDVAIDEDDVNGEATSAATLSKGNGDSDVISDTESEERSQDVASVHEAEQDSGTTCESDVIDESSQDVVSQSQNDADCKSDVVIDSYSSDEGHVKDLTDPLCMGYLAEGADVDWDDESGLNGGESDSIGEHHQKSTNDEAAIEHVTDDICQSPSATDASCRSAINGTSATDTVEQRCVNLDKVPCYASFQFCCSRNTNRVYVYDQEGNALDANFVPLDVQVGNYSQLPDILLHPENLKLVCRFVRQWHSLTLTKRRMVSKSGEMFVNPCLLYESLQSGRKASKQRYSSKADVGMVAMKKAAEVGGSVRLIQQPKDAGMKKDGKDEDRLLAELTSGETLSTKKAEELMESIKGLIQAVDADGVPLCVNCQKPYKNSLVSDKSVMSNPWHTRFCQLKCMQQYSMRSHREYTVREVYETEHGECQLCKVNAQDIFTKIRNTTDLEKRAKIIKDSRFNMLKTEVKEKMVKQPTKGLFWQVDHITAVSEGGGECELDNLRTLCTVCHRQVTSEQNRERAKRKRRQRAAQCGDITAFFQSK